MKTLKKKFKDTFKDMLTFKKDDDILKGAFIRKYESSTLKVNRNKGLPSIKNAFDKGVINTLKVLTNNVILQYGENIDSEILKHNFKGTLYCWELTSETIEQATN